MEKGLSLLYVWLGYVSSIILTVIGIAIFVVIIYMHINAKSQKPTIVAVLGILAIICVVNYRWNFVGFEIGDNFRFHIQSVFRDKNRAKLEEDSSIINSTATASKIEKTEGIGKPTPVPEKTLKNLEDFGYYLAQTKALNQYSFDDWYYKGAGEFINGKYDEAIISFTKAIEKIPENPYAYNYRGASYGRVGNNTEALKDFDKSSKLEPNNPLPYTNIAKIYIKQGKTVEAKEEVNKANNLIEDGKVNEGEIAFAKKEIKEVQKLLKQAK